MRIMFNGLPNDITHGLTNLLTAFWLVNTVQCELNNLKGLFQQAWLKLAHLAPRQKQICEIVGSPKAAIATLRKTELLNSGTSIAAVCSFRLAEASFAQG